MAKLSSEIDMSFRQDLVRFASSRLIQISGNLFVENGTTQIGDRTDMIHLRPKAVGDRNLQGATAIVRKGGKWFLKMYSGSDLPLQEASNPPSHVWKGFYLLGPNESHPRALMAQDYAKIFDSLKPKQKIEAALTSINKGEPREYTVGRKSTSKKYGVVSIEITPVGQQPPGRGAKIKLRKRGNSVTAAHGDMGVRILSLKVV